MIHFRWALCRTVLWTCTATAALGTLLVVVDSVESASRLGRIAAGVPWTSAVALAFLHLPELLVIQAPVVASLGSALAVAAAFRRGEWQGLAACGLGPFSRLSPALVSGCLVAAMALALGEWIVPPATLARARLEANLVSLPDASGTGSARPGFVLPELSGGWLVFPGLVVHVEPFPTDGSRAVVTAGQPVLGPVTAWQVRDSALASRWQADQLHWDGAAWAPDGPVSLVTWPGADPVTATPWASIPSPGLLGSLLDESPPSTKTFGALCLDPSPQARSELISRISRAFCTAPLALVAGAVAALLGPYSWAILVAVAPAVAAELFGIIFSASASQGTLSAWFVLLVRFTITLAALAFLLRPLRRPGMTG